MTEHDLKTSAGGRGYIADYFKTQLKRHDFTTYINERLAADFACALSQHLEAEAVARRESFAALERENEELKAKIDQLKYPQMCLEARKADAAEGQEDMRLLDWLEENLADTIYLDDGRIIDIAGRHSVREAIRKAAAPSVGGSTGSFWAAAIASAPAPANQQGDKLADHVVAPSVATGTAPSLVECDRCPTSGGCFGVCMRADQQQER